MKQLFISLFILMLCSSVFSQPATNPTPAVQTDYLKKSKKQKTAAWILAGSGMAIGIISVVSYNANDLVNLFEGDNRSSNTKAAFLIIGSAVALSSIPLFIVSSKNRHKAAVASVSMKIKRGYSAELFTVKSFAYPALTLKLSL